MKLLLTGVTGVAGLAIYRAALADSSVNHITLLTRRPIPSWAVLPPDAASKTTVILHKDFLSYPPDLAQRLAAHDACIWALGKSSKGVTEEEYTEMTHGYTLAAAQSLKDAGVGGTRTDGNPFRFVFISGEGVKQDAPWYMPLFSRVKGRAEKDLIALCNSADHMKAHIVRPGYFFPSLQYPEDRKNQRSSTAQWLDYYVLTPLYKLLIPGVIVPVEDLGRFTVGLASGRWANQEVFQNRDMLKLVKEL
ncbi:uncharacterized protein FIBRA_06155 [Fibroporia radiculosa]|uniref:NAD(P)-binding domain-containing protein n=1 Tax=Fibroporia radiculosa TaxID=599839 RepID=J4GAR2_9APHY|nr:uncharacterized protein FIBRA_06155 [Fibroporia radiculosa]CCM03998.1 predicted protein [Fibroporia radiculosa]